MATLTVGVVAVIIVVGRPERDRGDLGSVVLAAVLMAAIVLIATRDLRDGDRWRRAAEAGSDEVRRSPRDIVWLPSILVLGGVGALVADVVDASLLVGSALGPAAVAFFNAARLRGLERRDHRLLCMESRGWWRGEGDFLRVDVGQDRPATERR